MITLDHDGWHAAAGWAFGWPPATPKPRLHVIRHGDEVGRWPMSLCHIVIDPAHVRRDSPERNICVRCLERFPTHEEDPT